MENPWRVHGDERAEGEGSWAIVAMCKMIGYKTGWLATYPSHDGFSTINRLFYIHYHVASAPRCGIHTYIPATAAFSLPSM